VDTLLMQTTLSFVCTQQRPALTCQSVDLEGTSRCVVYISHKAGKATDAVAAHLGLAAVRVVDAHSVIGVANRGQGKDHLRSSVHSWR
jgi:hypothetical protein